MDMASDRPGDYSTGAGLETSPGQGALPGETTELVAVDGPRLLWRVRVWFGLGRRGRYHDYCVWTRTLPSGRIEVVGPRGRRRWVDPRAERCPCGWRGCVHVRAACAHVAEMEMRNGVVR